jgi:MFS family permease
MIMLDQTVVTVALPAMSEDLHLDPAGQQWVTGRAAQGAAAALMVPTSGAIVISAFPVQERGRAMAAYAGISQIFLAAGR